MSHSLHQKWNSTLDSIDPWTITSQNVHSQMKKSSNSKQDTLFNNVAYWSQNWDSPIDSNNKKNIVSPKEYSFFEVSSDKDWELKDSSKKKKNLNNIEEELNLQSRYKTELCRSWSETGSCRYGPKCQFAHGEEELRPLLRHPKYKTELCRSWSETGSCPYGNRCRFIHNEPITPPKSKKDLVDSLSELQISNDNDNQQQKLVSDSGIQQVKVENNKKVTRLPFFKGLCL